MFLITKLIEMLKRPVKQQGRQQRNAVKYLIPAYRRADKPTNQHLPTETNYKNARSLLSYQQWQTVRQQVFAEQGKQCLYCENQATDCHEIFDLLLLNGKPVQKLVSIEPVCKDCHAACHLLRHKYDLLSKQPPKALCDIIKKRTAMDDNGFRLYQTPAVAIAVCEAAKLRLDSHRGYSIDMTFLNRFGVGRYSDNETRFDVERIKESKDYNARKKVVTLHSH